MTLPLVGVLWDDANGTANEDIDSITLPEFHGPVPLITFGLLLRDDAIGITLVTEKYQDREMWRANKFIPRPLVKDMWVVSPDPLRRPRRKKMARGEKAPVSADPLLNAPVEPPS